MSNDIRVSKGIPTGGQFDKHDRTEATVTLDVRPPVSTRFSSPPVVGADTGAMVTLNIMERYAENAGDPVNFQRTKNMPYVVVDTVDYLNDASEHCRAYQVAGADFKRLLDMDGSFDKTVDGKWVTSGEFKLVTAAPKAPTVTAAAEAPVRPAPTPMAETQRSRRGHMFITAESKKWPSLYSTEDTPIEDKKIVAHYFGGSCDWYVAEYDPTTYEAFGYADLGMGGGEWGSFNLQEIEAINAHRGMLIMERDCHFDKGTSSEVIARYMK